MTSSISDRKKGTSLHLSEYSIRNWTKNAKLQGSEKMPSLPYKRKFQITQVFLNQSDKYASGYHLGVDLVGLEDKTIYAIQDGTVIHAGYSTEFGNTVVIQQNDRLYCRYSHLETILVQNRQNVINGETAIGIEGKTGRVWGGTDPRHLDLRISVKAYHTDNITDYKNPCDYLGFPNRLNYRETPGGSKMPKIKNLIICESEIDKRAAGYLADFLKCKIIELDLLPSSVLDDVFENIYVIGSPAKPVAKAINIVGNDRYDTCQKVINMIRS